jgi:hypothetical protein
MTEQENVHEGSEHVTPIHDQVAAEVVSGTYVDQSTESQNDEEDDAAELDPEKAYEGGCAS